MIIKDNFFLLNLKIVLNFYLLVEFFKSSIYVAEKLTKEIKNKFNKQNINMTNYFYSLTIIF